MLKIIPNDNSVAPGQEKYSNTISTTKYNLVTFLPLFLYIQYTQPSNIFYLLNAIAGYIVYVIEPLGNVVPLVFCLILACVRELYEDISKALQDRQTNNTIYQVKRKGQFVDTKSKDIKPGDIIMIQKETLCPVDGIIVQGDPNIFISTANLDGE